jgi:hypothetical protein
MTVPPAACWRMTDPKGRPHMRATIVRIVVAAALVGASLITEVTFPKAAPAPAGSALAPAPASLDYANPQHNQVLLG